MAGTWTGPEHAAGSGHRPADGVQARDPWRARLAAYIHSHRKWIIGAALSAAASVCGYVWPHSPWIGTVIGVVAVGLGVNYIGNRHEPGQQNSPAGKTGL